MVVVCEGGSESCGLNDCKGLLNPRRGFYIRLVHLVTVRLTMRRKNQ